MKNYKYLLLVSTCLLFNNNSQASELDLTFNSSSLPLGINTTLHTHTPNVGLKPISNFVKLAAVCSVTSKGGCNGLGFGSSDNDINFDSKKQCSEEGYIITSCPSEQIKINQCPYDNSYYKNCSTSDALCKSEGYNITSCSKPQYPTTPCAENSAYYKSCQEDNVKACQEDGYVSDCAKGEIADVSKSCPYDAVYNKCICNPCAGYDFTIIEAQAEGWHIMESCSNCGSLKYKREPESCAGYLTCDFGGAPGATSCMSGNIKMFSSCKEEQKVCSAGLWDLDNYYCNGALRCYVKE